MVTKQIKGKLDKSVEEVNDRIQECIEILSTSGRVSKDQARSMIKKLNLRIPNEAFSNKSSAEYYAKKLLDVDFLDNIKLIFSDILDRPGFSRTDLLEIVEDMRIPGFKINSLNKAVQGEFGFNIWGDFYSIINIKSTPDGNGYVVE